MEQVENDRLVAFIVGKVYPTDCNKDSKRRLREKAASFLVIDGELHHKGFEQRVQRVVIGRTKRCVSCVRCTQTLLVDVISVRTLQPLRL
jgi:hypothetical protein